MIILSNSLVVFHVVEKNVQNLFSLCWSQTLFGACNRNLIHKSQRLCDEGAESAKMHFYSHELGLNAPSSKSICWHVCAQSTKTVVLKAGSSGLSPLTLLYKSPKIKYTKNIEMKKKKQTCTGQIK